MVIRESFSAGQDFTTADQYKAVKIDSTDTTDSRLACELAGAGNVAMGILQTTELTGYEVKVVTAGATKAMAGAAISDLTKPCKINASGKVISVTTDKDFYLGWPKSVATADGDIIELFVAPGYYAA